MKKTILPPVVIFANWWWWSMFLSDHILGLMMLFSGLLTWQALRKNKKLLFLVAIVIMSVVQWKTTVPRSLTNLTNDQQRLVEERKSAYPPITWAPVAYYLEEKPVTIAVGRWMGSIFENLDINQYFFANHPREGVTTNAVEKLPFILLPMALLGLYLLFFSDRMLLILSMISISVLAFWGNQNKFGAVATWPLWIASIDTGWRKLSRGNIYIRLLFVAALTVALWQKSFLFF